MCACRVIYFYGPDGSGKSTISHEFVMALKREGLDAKSQWMRFNHYISRIINAIGHMAGLSFHETYSDGTKIGYHHYYKSRFLSIAYCMSTILDTFFVTIFKLWIPMIIYRKVIVLDRFVFDTIVDLSVDTNNPNLLSSWQGKLLRRLLPSKSLSIYLYVDKEVISKRRPDTQWDEAFDARHGLYKKVYDIFKIGYKVDNSGNIWSTLKIIDDLFEGNEKKRSRVTV